MLPFVPGLVAGGLAALVLLSGCGRHHAVTIDPGAGAVGAAGTVLVAASRRPADPPALYSRERDPALQFGRFVVSVPPEREPGTVTWPAGPAADPATDFVTVSAARLRDREAFVAAIDREIDREGNPEVAIFVHGFNNTFAEGLYRQVQLAHDFRLPDVSVNYAWPSAGSLRAYVSDKESAIFAARGLADLVETVALSRVERIVVIGHSMGGLVVMEGLRELALRASPAFDDLHAVLLLAPDVDLDIFRQQMASLRGRDVPVYIFASARDRALRLSSRLQGGRVRLGALTDETAVADLPVFLIDVTDVQGRDPTNHNVVASSPLMFALVTGLAERGAVSLEDAARANPGLIEAGVHGLEQATRVVINPFARAP